MRRPVRFEPVGEPVTEPVTKLGGQPVWLAEPQWPFSASTGAPMAFIGQFELAADEPRLAYVFMTEQETYVDATWEPEGGENAVIIQPGGRVPGFVRVRPRPAGPAVPTADHLPIDEPPDHVPVDGEPWEFLGGEPNWIQGDETPGPGWRLIAQLSDAYGNNFGDAGVGYAFVSPDGLEGRFLWQCA